MSRQSTGKYIVGALIVVFFQIIFAPRLAMGGVQADMGLVLVVWVALETGRREGTLFGFWVGLAMGVLNPAQLGWSALLMGLMGYAIGSVKTKLVIEPITVRLGVLIIAALIYNAVFLFFTGFELYLINPWHAFAVNALAAVLSMVLAVMTYYFIRYRYLLRKLF